MSSSNTFKVNKVKPSLVRQVKERSNSFSENTGYLPLTALTEWEQDELHKLFSVIDQFKDGNLLPEQMTLFQ